MLFQTRFNTSFKMYRLLTVQGGFVHADIRYNFENCYKAFVEEWRLHIHPMEYGSLSNLSQNICVVAMIIVQFARTTYNLSL